MRIKYTDASMRGELKMKFSNALFIYLWKIDHCLFCPYLLLEFSGENIRFSHTQARIMSPQNKLMLKDVTNLWSVAFSKLDNFNVKWGFNGFKNSCDFSQNISFSLCSGIGHILQNLVNSSLLNFKTETPFAHQSLCVL